MGENSAFVSLHNDGSSAQGIELQPKSIEAFGESFPTYTKLTVPIEVATSDNVSCFFDILAFF